MRTSIATLLLALLLASAGWAQQDAAPTSEEESSDVQSVEKEIDQRLPGEIVRPEVKFKKPAAKALYQKVAPDVAEDFAIIQKNYMPKTGRWQGSLLGSYVPSDVLYKTFGASARLGYHFSERWGFELSASSYSSTKGDDLKAMEEKQRITANNQSTVGQIYSANLYYNQVYGKMGLFDQKIVPFELYNIVGVGTLRDQGGGSTPAYTVGIGDLFSITRSSAVRLELSVTVFEQASSSSANSNSKSMANFIFLNFGYSHFFPEPDYR